MTKLFFSLLAATILSQPAFSADKISKKKINTLRERSVTSLEEDLKTLEEQNKAGNEELAQYKKDVEDRMAEKLSLQEKIDKAQIEKSRLDERVAFQKKQYHTADHEMTTLAKTNEKLSVEIKHLETAIDSQEIIVKQAQEKLDLARGLNKDVKNKREKLVGSLTDSVSERKNLLKDSDSNLKEVARLKKQMAALQVKLAAATKNNKAAQASYNITNSILAKEKALNQAETAKVQAKEDSITDLNRMIRAGKEEVERVRKEHQQLIQRGQKADAEKPRLQLQASELKEQYQTLNSRAIAVQKGH